MPGTSVATNDFTNRLHVVIIAAHAVWGLTTYNPDVLHGRADGGPHHGTRNEPHRRAGAGPGAGPSPHGAHPSPGRPVIPPSLRTAHDRFLKRRLLEGINPQAKPSFWEALSVPITDWGFSEAGHFFDSSDSILTEDGLLTPVAHDLYQYSAANPELEFGQWPMREIFDICRRGEYAEAYRHIRTWFIKNPITDTGSLLELLHSDTVLDCGEHTEPLQEWIKRAYETIPPDFRPGRKVFSCPNCSWTLHPAALPPKEPRFNCHNDVCSRLTRGFNDPAPKKKAYRNTMRRLTRGMVASVVVPGLPELDLKERLKKVAGVDAVELYPGVDRYDIRVKTPNAIYAIDVKDYSRPLTFLWSQIELPSDPPWNRGFFVIPDSRVELHPGYFNVLKNKVNTSGPIRFVTSSKFIRLIKGEVGR